MARNAILVDAPPEAVFEVLSDPRLYGGWVVGASTTLGVEGRWPEPGSLLRHVQLLVLKDTTSVLESEPPRRLLLEVRARPLVVARVELELRPQAGGTHVTLDERPTGGLLAALPRALSDAMLHVRNRETVRRLKALAEIGRQLGRA